MRVVITSLGSIGDIQPFIALASCFRRHGHHCLFALPIHLMPYAAEQGFEAVQIGPDSLGEASYEVQRVVAMGPLASEATIHAANDRYASILREAAEPALRRLLDLCSTSDVLISLVTMPLGRIVHELTGKPFVSVQVCPGRSAGEPAALDDPLNMFRAEVGLPPVDDSLLHGYSPDLSIIAISKELLPPDPAWPAHYVQTGFFFLDEDKKQPEKDLIDFLNAGPRPVVVTLGSMNHEDSTKFTRIFASAFEAVGCRAIVQRGWTGLGDGIELPDYIHVADYIPHQWLFPRAACVIHHGGTGTTAAAFRAGVPTIMIPHALDSYYSANRAKELGNTSTVISLLDLSAESLSAALAETLNNRTYQESAEALAARIRMEQGVENAVDHVNRYVNSKSRVPA